MSVSAAVEEGVDAKAAPRLYWWKEALIIGAFYGLYTLTRNQFGSARLSKGELPHQAYNNARRLIRLERHLGLFHEERLQSAFSSFHWFIRFWNVFYGTAHFVVTIVLFVLLFRNARWLFTRWRNVILATTALALLGFSLFPVMPPRLLDSTYEFGGACIQIEQSGGECTKDALEHYVPTYGIEDTLDTDGALWSFDSGAVSKLSNQYAAMPSLHCAWATWCALVGWRLFRKRWVRALLVIYPFLTLFCIIVTGNHYWIDGIGGLITLAVGYFVGHEFDAWNDRRLERKATAATA